MRAKAVLGEEEERRSKMEVGKEVSVMIYAQLVTQHHAVICSQTSIFPPQVLGRMGRRTERM